MTLEQQVKAPLTQIQGMMHQYNVSAPFERVTINITEPFLETWRGNQYLLIARDYYTKYHP